MEDLTDQAGYIFEQLWGEMRACPFFHNPRGWYILRAERARVLVTQWGLLKLGQPPSRLALRKLLTPVILRDFTQTRHDACLRFEPLGVLLDAARQLALGPALVTPNTLSHTQLLQLLAEGCAESHQRDPQDLRVGDVLQQCLRSPEVVEQALLLASGVGFMVGLEEPEEEEPEEEKEKEKKAPSPPTPPAPPAPPTPPAPSPSVALLNLGVPEMSFEQVVRWVCPRREQAGVRVAAPSPLWPGGELWQQHFERVVRNLLIALKVGRGRQFRDTLRGVGLSAPCAVRGTYDNLPGEEQPEVIALNRQLTRAVNIAGGEWLESLVVRTVEKLQARIRAHGFGPGEVRLAVKGSRPVSIVLRRRLLAGAGETVPPPRTRQELRLRGAAQKVMGLFESGDIDVDVLIDEALPRERFAHIHSTVTLLAMGALVELKRTLQRGPLLEALFTAVLARVPGVRSSTRRSFLIQRMLKDDNAEIRPVSGPSRPGPLHLQALVEVDRFRALGAAAGAGAAKAAPTDLQLTETGVYLSSNTLCYYNGRHPSHFGLLRCMLAFRDRQNQRRLRGEVLDICILHQTHSQLRFKWNHVVPNLIRIPRTRLETMSLPALFNETLDSVLNDAQPHKSSVRIERLAGLQELFDVIADDHMLEATASNPMIGRRELGQLLRRCKLMHRIGSGQDLRGWMGVPEEEDKEDSEDPSEDPEDPEPEETSPPHLSLQRRRSSPGSPPPTSAEARAAHRELRQRLLVLADRAADRKLGNRMRLLPRAAMCTLWVSLTQHLCGGDGRVAPLRAAITTRVLRCALALQEFHTLEGDVLWLMPRAQVDEVVRLARDEALAEREKEKGETTTSTTPSGWTSPRTTAR